MKKYELLVIGGGPAGLAAAESAAKENARVILTEREARLGGILKQCIHDGFGLIKFGEKLSGSEYATKAIHSLDKLDIDIRTLTFVTKILDLTRVDDSAGIVGLTESLPIQPLLYEGYRFKIDLVSENGVETILTKTIVLATGCRERTAKQIGIHGTRPAGVITAGSAQYYLNILGQLPGKKCVILGSGDIGLIMARRLTIEGAEVLGVYEAKPVPSGLRRNIYQCLDDYDIPLHLSMTVSKVHGKHRVEGVTLVKVDENMRPIANTEEYLACDTLILSVGLIPENELAETLGVEINPFSKGPTCDELYMTNIDGVFSCGNALHVNDLADYVSESGEAAGKNAALYAMRSIEEGLDDSKKSECSREIRFSKDFLYVVPHKLSKDAKEVTVFFRSSEERSKTKLSCKIGDRVMFEKTYLELRPPEMEKVIIKIDGDFDENEDFVLELVEA